jgi:hypothetical protein
LTRFTPKSGRALGELQAHIILDSWLRFYIPDFADDVGSSQLIREHHHFAGGHQSRKPHHRSLFEDDDRARLFMYGRERLADAIRG